ncbi:Protein farnesyltransferase subunit beta [Golovinomyces cichoracearum]|uniref:Protein farnesyltransferase subunit beta n=1 Tax=Golovinomyces cichoracearum TaxID=62708 RepID=A0A420J7W5_9PEZI|nr:Protein farnesyltransferase subunit beta [Golovinomyces cichoracearum]
MGFLVTKGRLRHRVLFQKRASTAPTSPSLTGTATQNKASHLTHEIISNDSSTDSSIIMNSAIPDLFKSFPPLYGEHLSTDTAQKQNDTILECLPFLRGIQNGLKYNEHGVLGLDRQRHIAFLTQSLKKLPSQFVTADASRPWIFYWSLNGLAMMGQDVSRYEKPLISTLRPIQNITGGFGGGHGQMSHLAPTYATILALAIVGGPESFDLIDRRAMWKWLGSLKQLDGGFRMAVDGEEDVRGAYCAVVIIALLNLPIELERESPLWSREGMSLLSGLPEWISRCQTFEGGIAARPDAEAHGAYTFCALACLCMLGDPHEIIPRYLNVPSLVSWLSARQYAPEGGFSGRTNKLVDGCYSHWVGGCWPFVDACLEGLCTTGVDTSKEVNNLTSKCLMKSLYNREGLIRYILCCCQDLSKRGGLRDKPSHRSDSYHTCYVLAGLSSAQNKWRFDVNSCSEIINGFFTSAFSWTSEAYTSEKQIYDEADRLNTIHPIFAIPELAVHKIHTYFSSKRSF